VSQQSSLRREDRNALSAKVRLTWQDERGASHFGYGQGINISLSGLAVLFEETIPLRSNVGFEIPRMKLRGSGSVRYLRRKGLKQIIGLQFIGSFRWNPQAHPLPEG
jgi:hypothetical protein